MGDVSRRNRVGLRRKREWPKCRRARQLRDWTGVGVSGRDQGARERSLGASGRGLGASGQAFGESRRILGANGWGFGVSGCGQCAGRSGRLGAYGRGMGASGRCLDRNMS